MLRDKAFREKQEELTEKLRKMKTYNKEVQPLPDKETKPKGKKRKMRKTPTGKRVQY